MNCKNCGTPVDGHIACPKCGQLVDFTGSISNTSVRTSYGISWEAEEETPAAKPISEPVEDTKVESVVEQPVVEVQAKTEEKKAVVAEQAKPEEQPVVEVQTKAEEKSILETSVKSEPEKLVVETSVKPESEKLVVENKENTAPPVVESKTDTSEDESEDISIFDTFSEAMNDIAEDMVAIGDEMKEDIADVVANISDAIASAYPEEDDDEEIEEEPYQQKEEEPYQYKENKYEFSGSTSSFGAQKSSKSIDDSVESKPLMVALATFVGLIVLAMGAASINNENKIDEYQRESQQLYDKIDYDSLQRINSIFNNSSSSSTVEEEPVVYVYADLGKIYNSDGESIEISEDAIVKSAGDNQKIAYIQDGQLYLVDGDLEPEPLADSVKDFHISPNGADLAYIYENDSLVYRKCDKNDFGEYNIAYGVDSFVFTASTREAGFLYLAETDEGKVLSQCDKNGQNRSIIASGECKPLSVSYDLHNTFYLDENNRLHRYYDGNDEDIEYDVTINDNSEYITSNDKSAILVNNIAVDGKIYCANKFTKELSVIDEPGLSEVDIYEATKAVVALAVTYQSDEGLVEVKFGPSGSTKYVITENTNVDCFAINAKEDVVLYKLDNQLYEWSKADDRNEVIDEDASDINNIAVSSDGDFYYLKGSELYCVGSSTYIARPNLVSADVDKIVTYTDNAGQVTMGFAKTDFTQYILTTRGNYIQK
ncbi:zinc ribbon domain-containing protein [Pseudobutyrivibrio sp.]|uniref:zinc ribbon domain-containing protein n=1 Tax=Pseudobutyrivibrio sp. TaxID=2014367 RepID=UPI0025FB1234|nr:zinc ribbon domain-containing protein [Pseudobutyrivibrio sp.]MBR5649460.1 hypothetical protein [Pseudobutyrivibrio sp.]